MLKKDSFLEAESGGDDVLTSLPLEGGRGGEEVDGPRPPDRLSMLGEELTVRELWPEAAPHQTQQKNKSNNNNDERRRYSRDHAMLLEPREKLSSWTLV